MTLPPLLFYRCLRALVLTLFVCAGAAWAGDPNACISRCTEKMAGCTKPCRDDKCVRRCADQLIPCQSGCNDGKYSTKESRNSKNTPPAPPKGAAFGKVR